MSDKVVASSYKGFWSLRCDSEADSPVCSTGVKTMLQIVRKLPLKFPELFPIPPKAAKSKEFWFLQVFTSDDSCEEVHKSAEAIRSNVDFPFIMYYFKTNITDSMDKTMLYRHTPKGELHTSRYMDREYRWKLISNETKPATAFEKLLPSQVTDRDFIHLPANEEDFEKTIDRKGGKWILHCLDWKTLDNFWRNLIILYDTEVLVGLKARAPKFSVTKNTPNPHTKAIMCYTADAHNKACVKRAAQRIYLCTEYDLEMYYKSNQDSADGKYRHEGSKTVSKYMITSSGEMFERDYLGRWKEITFLEEKQ